MERGLTRSSTPRKEVSEQQYPVTATSRPSARGPAKRSSEASEGVDGANTYAPASTWCSPSGCWRQCAPPSQRLVQLRLPFA